MPRLIINPGTPQAAEFLLKPGNNYIGRGFANDFRLEDPSVSGSHCEIVVHGGAALLKDLGSTNGTFINRQPITEGALQSGQVLHLGNVEMLFEDDPATGAIGSVTTASAPIALNA